MAQFLLVEDDVLLGEVVKSALEQDGHVVALAHNAAWAQKLWRTVRFDLRLLDLRLPDGSGLNLYAGLRDTPIIFLPVNDADGDVVRGFRMGGCSGGAAPAGAGCAAADQRSHADCPRLGAGD